MSHTNPPAPGATAPSAALSTSQGPGAGLSVAEARTALFSIATDERRRWTHEFSDTVDALIEAVRAEALEPREQSPELVEIALRRYEEHFSRQDAALIRAEFARLRAQLEASRADVRRLLAGRGGST